MATKKKLVEETVAPKAATKAAAPKRHSKAIPATETPAAEPSLDSREVAQLAYSYFEQRGYRHGSQVEDWFRAESELRQRHMR